MSSVRVKFGVNDNEMPYTWATPNGIYFKRLDWAPVNHFITRRHVISSRWNPDWARIEIQSHSDTVEEICNMFYPKAFWNILTIDLWKALASEGMYEIKPVGRNVASIVGTWTNVQLKWIRSPRFYLWKLAGRNLIEQIHTDTHG